jgi:hypothetical protein
MLLTDLLMFNDFNSEKQREIIGDVMHAINDTVTFFCKMSGSSNMKFLVGMNTIATKMFLLMYDPVINPRLGECRGTVPQPISVNKEFLLLVNEYNTLLLEYNQYLNIQRYNTEYVSVIAPTDRRYLGNPVERSIPQQQSFPPTGRPRGESIYEQPPEQDDDDGGYISSDDDSFGDMNINNVL